MEVLYISNDETSEDLSKFYETNLASFNCCYLPFNEEAIFQIREAYQIDCVPALVVLDKNRQVITYEGS